MTIFLHARPPAGAGGQAGGLASLSLAFTQGEAKVGKKGEKGVKRGVTMQRPRKGQVCGQARSLGLRVAFTFFVPGFIFVFTFFYLFYTFFFTFFSPSFH